jgi:Ca-activated chloride channel homolog
MKTLVRIVGAGLAATTITAAVLLQACATQPMAGRPQRERQMSASNRATAGWQPQGFGQTSGDLSASGTSNFPTDWPSAGKPEVGQWATGLEQLGLDGTAVPRIELQEALRQSQGGEGGGRTPFREGDRDLFLLGSVQGDSAVTFDPAVKARLEEQEVLRSRVHRLADYQRAQAASFVTPAPGVTEELWIIQRPRDWTVAPDDNTPRSGALMCRLPDDCPRPEWVPAGQSDVPVPLKHTDVQASIVGYISSVTVKQQFHNPYSSKIEALYVFPLPENAGVNDFVMTIGERRIRGIIREREEARQIYDQAKAQGHVASLMTQERPNIFTQHVANIEPGKAIDIDITYFSTLSFSDGAYEFAFPMVVGPRFNPPGSTTGVGAAPRLGQGTTSQQTEVQYLHPTERSGHDISLAVDIDAGVEVERVDSKSHVIKVSRDSQDPGKLKVRLADSDTIPNKDFVLRYTVAGDTVKSALVAQADPRGNGGYFTLMLIPPRELASLPRTPMEMVFVVDRSGSMDGKPIEQARAAVERGLRLLEPGDSFQIIDFSDTASQLGPRPLEATPENIRAGMQYAAGLDARGGTMMVNGLRAALDFPHDPRRLRFVCFLTDGFIGNEAEILTELAGRLGDSRIFAMGVGSSVNRYLIAEMSRMGRGAVAYLGLNDSASDTMDQFFQRISHPALANVRLDWSGAAVSDVVPACIPDLFVGRPVIITGRYQGSFEGTIKVLGAAGGIDRELAISPEPAQEQRKSALASVWARAKIGELSAQMLAAPAAAIPEQVKRLALDYGLMSAFTSFVAVDCASTTQGEYGTTVPVPVVMPEGVSYKTTVPER